MIFVALAEAAEKGEVLFVDGGFCRWHRRRDGVVVIREILVVPQKRRQKIGRKLLAEVISRSPDRVIRARCPVKYESGNSFWKAMGFTLIEEKDGINLWQRPAHP